MPNSFSSKWLNTQQNDDTRSNISLPPHNSTCRATFCGCIAAVLSSTALFPFSKTIDFQQIHYDTWRQAGRRLQKDGVHKIFRGALPPILQRAIGRTIMFGCFTSFHNNLSGPIKSVFVASSPPSSSSSSQPASQTTTLSNCHLVTVSVAALLTGLVEVSLMPLERVQIVMETEAHYGRYRNSVHAFRSIPAEFGVGELFRGVRIVTLRNCLANLVYFHVKESWMPASRHAFARDFVLGGSCAAAIGLMTFPLNVAKCAVQSRLGHGHWLCDSSRGTLSAVFVSRNKSVRAMYRGIAANSVRSVISWGLVTALFNLLMDSDWTARVCAT